MSVCSHRRIMQPQTTVKACCELHGDMQIQGVSTPWPPDILINSLLPAWKLYPHHFLLGTILFIGQSKSDGQAELKWIEKSSPPMGLG